MSRKAVVLMNLGGPDSLDAVEPFLCNLFSDPYIISIPFGFIFRKPLARYIARRRSPRVREQYAKIGGKSPINEWTEKQRSMLEQKLREIDDTVDVHIAMRYWRPYTGEAVAEIARTDCAAVILTPLYPHYSVTTTGSSFAEWDRVYTGNTARIEKIESYYENPGYIAAINLRIDEALAQFPENVRRRVRLVFSAHGTPVKLVKRGDPYKRHIEATVRAVMMQRRDKREHTLCFQSRVGPEKWLEPSTKETIEALARRGEKHLLVVPVSFVSDHLETLFELGIEYRRIAERAGVETYAVTQGFNDSEIFISALAEEVAKRL